MTLVNRVRSSGGMLIASLGRMDTANLVGLLTLFAFVFHGGKHWYFDVPAQILLLCSLVYAPLRTKPIFWLLIVSLLASYWSRNWVNADTHKYLMTYMSLVLFLVYLAPEKYRDGLLAGNGQLIIGLVFLIATATKAFSSDFLDGTFFQYEMLFDHRLSGFTTLATGIDLEALQNLRGMEKLMKEGYSLSNDVLAIDLPQSLILIFLCHFLVWWTLILEGLIGILFLPWGENRKLFALRNALFITFVATTYPVALVRGFAWTIIALGIAQVPKDHPRLRAVYLFLFLVFIPLCEVPWVSTVYKILGW